MTSHSEKSETHVCPYSARHAEKKKLFKKLLFPITGLAALIWFFIRVIPKPSRAAYPCQRAAFPIASSFVIWLTGIFGGALIFKKLRKSFYASRYIVAGIGGAAILAAVVWNLHFFPAQKAYADFTPVKLAKSNVSIVQSAKSDVKQIDYTEIKQMVSEAVAGVGGIGSVVKDGDTVVLKPNLVYSMGYAAEANGVTTDWRVTKAVAELVRSVNPSGKVYIMEGSAIDTSMLFNSLKYTSANIPEVDGILAIEKDSGAWQDKNSAGLTLVNMPDGLLHTQYYFNRKYKEADVVISIPTLKTHYNAGITGGIKNLAIGTVPGNIYGKSETQPDRNNAVDHYSDDLHKWIRDYYKCRPADLVIMDGLQGLQNGPIPSNTTDLTKDQMNMRLILAGKDAVAVDSIESLVVGYDPESIGYLRYLNTDKLGNIDPTCINIVGKKVDEVRKYFEGTATLGAAKITDKTAPQLTIDSVQAVGNNMKISMTADSETVKESVYIDGKLYEPSSASGMTAINVDISGLTGNHQLTVEAYDRFLNRTTKTAEFTASGYSAPRAAQAPVIDGIGNESCWQQAQWKDINYVWLGNTPTADDFSGRFKMVWTPERLYYLVEITDDKLSAPNTTPLKNYYDNDCVELFIDENHSGGNHQNNYNAFAYHIELDYDIIDNNTSGTQSFYNDHAKVLRTKNGNVYTWEIELKVFDDKYNEKVTTNVPVTLTNGKIMGFGVSYNDNDYNMTRDNFMGSMDIPGTDKNVAWINADVFDTLTLVDTALKKGDINNDSGIDALDYAMLKSHLLKITNLTGDALSAADFNSDGLVDALDLAQLKLYLLERHSN